jgi:hypothetical protein
MKRLMALLGMSILAQSVAAQTATERAEKRLAELLAPGSSVSARTFASRPVAWKPAAAVETIELPIKAYAGVPVRLPNPPPKDVKPGAAPEGAPLVAFQDKTKVPKQPELPTKPLIRLPSLDVHTPLPIPILAQPVKDRAPLGEPGFEASLDAALKRWTPTRDRPVPFVPLNLPDPFEHMRYGQLRNAPPENPMPPVIPLTRPTK